jgi:hypothetical protein
MTGILIGISILLTFAVFAGWSIYEIITSHRRIKKVADMSAATMLSLGIKETEDA